MAGGRIFLEPILQDTVGNIGESVDSVVTAVEPIPDKIDTQIEKLTNLSQIMSSAVSVLNVESGDDESVDIQTVSGSTSGAVASTSYTKVASIALCTFKSLAQGTIKVTCDVSSYVSGTVYRSTSSGSYTAYACIALAVVDPNGTEYISDLGTAHAATSTTKVTINYTDAFSIENIAVDSNEEYTAYIYLYIKSSSSNGGGGELAAISGNTLSINYNLLDIIDEGAFLEVS